MINIKIFVGKSFSVYYMTAVSDLVEIEDFIKRECGRVIKPYKVINLDTGQISIVK